MNNQNKLNINIDISCKAKCDINKLVDQSDIDKRKADRIGMNLVRMFGPISILITILLAILMVVHHFFP